MNLVLSPYSISAVMVLVAEGGTWADGRSVGDDFSPGLRHTESRPALFRPQCTADDSGERGHRRFGGASTGGFSSVADGQRPAQGHAPHRECQREHAAASPALVLANGLWIQKGVKLLESYLHEVQNQPGALIQDVDFRDHPRQAAEIINEWIGHRTSGRNH